MPAVQFSEHGEWRATPQWADFLIKLGHSWPVTTEGNRRIALISMPCDSAGAGLVTLGAMIRDFENPKANDMDGHYESLLRYARQYIEACSVCHLEYCNPIEKGCGYTQIATGKIRSESDKIYTISDRTDFAARQLAFVRKNVITMPYPQSVIDWHIDGEPPSIWNNATGQLNPGLYQHIAGDAQFVQENLRSSFSGLCFAGRSTGESRSREICATIRFRNQSEERGLDELLTIQGWTNTGVSRVTFFNSRSNTLDRNALKPSLVIADGDSAFLNALSRREFQCSDIIGLVHRVHEREKLETLGSKMQDLAQWYTADEDMLCNLPNQPRGLSVSILRRSH